ncbi:hypothetical protein M405DRAFT_745479 [Rhizopogon salebrosus TDB-379]|nr:hypothetical protein M405DRAFT_745479 [Rhizopogon salebrosus TDB-379]
MWRFVGKLDFTIRSLILTLWLRFSMRSHRFMDAYRKGLDGRQAAWASKKYRGHRVLPETIMAELEAAGLN